MHIYCLYASVFARVDPASKCKNFTFMFILILFPGKVEFVITHTHHQAVRRRYLATITFH